MNQDELETRVYRQQEADLELLLRKDNDYNGPDNSLGGFRDFGFLGVLVRLSDKLTRIKTLYKSGNSRVPSESVIDTLQDIRNYAHIGQIVLEQEWESYEQSTDTTRATSQSASCTSTPESTKS